MDALLSWYCLPHILLRDLATPNGWAFSCRERAACDGLKKGTISRAKRSDCMRVLARLVYFAYAVQIRESNPFWAVAFTRIYFRNQIQTGIVPLLQKRDELMEKGKLLFFQLASGKIELNWVAC